MSRYWRQNDLVDQEKLQEKITVIGAGSIGSFVVLTLAKLGCKNVEVFDFDHIEEHNLPNQFYRNCDLGRSKVEALRSLVRDFESFDISAKNEKFIDQDLSGYVIFAVDSMDERKQIWEKAVKLNPMVKKLFDARMGGESLRLLSVNPVNIDDMTFYEKRLYPSAEALQLPCTARAILYNILAIASLVCNNVKKAMLGEDIEREIAFDLKNLNLYTRHKQL